MIEIDIQFAGKLLRALPAFEGEFPRPAKIRLCMHTLPIHHDNATRNADHSSVCRDRAENDRTRANFGMIADGE